MPARPPAVDKEVSEKRLQTANEARAAGLAKITGFEVIDPETGIVRVPIEEAMDLIIAEYRVAEAVESSNIKN